MKFSAQFAGMAQTPAQDPDRFAPVNPRPPREKILNAPALPVLLALSMPGLYALQRYLPDEGLRWAFQPLSLVEGGWWPGVLTSMFLHGSWGHALVNAGFAFAFGPPVARLFAGLKGGLVFLGYYIVCGLVGTLGYGLVHLGSDAPLVGASGAVTGLLGGAIRLMGGDGRPRPLTDRGVIGMSAAILILNAVTGMIGLAPGVEGAQIAWEAHAFGFMAGLLLIGPVARWFGTARPAFASSGGMGDPRG